VQPFQSVGHIEKYEAHCGLIEALIPSDVNIIISLAVNFNGLNCNIYTHTSLLLSNKE
jgi:hypothetical protein